MNRPFVSVDEALQRVQEGLEKELALEEAKCNSVADLRAAGIAFAVGYVSMAREMHTEATSRRKHL